jgi:hypothetical protein
MAYYPADAVPEDLRQPADPARAVLYTYPGPVPAEPWAYELDSGPNLIKYRRGLVCQRLRPGWWPFAYADPAMEQQARHRTSKPVAQECGVAGIQLSPDTEYRAWGDESVTVSPDTQVPHLAGIRYLYIPVRVQGSCRVVVYCSVALNLLDGTWQLHGADDDWGPLTAEADSRSRKIMEFLRAAIAQRDAGNGPAAPLTAYERYMAAKQRQALRLRAYPGTSSRAWRRARGRGGRRPGQGKAELARLTGELPRRGSPQYRKGRPSQHRRDGRGYCVADHLHA